jgi:hypothetical protein
VKSCENRTAGAVARVQFTPLASSGKKNDTGGAC